MKLLPLGFRDDPARLTAALLKAGGFPPGKTLLVVPSQRFKSSLAASLMEEWGTDGFLIPELLTSEELSQALGASLGLQTANDAQEYAMFHEACASSADAQELFPERFLARFLPFRGVARRTLRAFDELNGEEIDLRRARFPRRPYGQFGRHLELFRNLYERYGRVQRERGTYGRSFLLRFCSSEDVERFFSRYDAVLLVLPVSLTAFERRMYRRIEQKLLIVFQDTADFDFSSVLAYREARPKATAVYPAVRMVPSPSRIHQLMLALSVLEEEAGRGEPLHEIAVLNMDPLFCRMLYDSLAAAGIPVNYSAGLPVKTSPLYTLLELVHRFFESGMDTGAYLELLAHPLLAEAFRLEGYELFRREKKRVCGDRIFRLQPGVHRWNPRHSDLLKPGAGPTAAKKNMRPRGANPDESDFFPLLGGIHHAESFAELYDRLSDLVERMERKKSYDFYAVREVLLSTAAECVDLNLNVEETPFEIFLHLSRNRLYPLAGVYTSGVQILGLLETRGIPFRTVLVPSFNEGLFPHRESEDVLLNLQVRADLGMPTHLDKETLQFYYLKRLVDSSERACFFPLQDKTGAVDVKSRYCYHFTEDPYPQDPGKPAGVSQGSEETTAPPDLPYTLPVRTGADGSPRRTELSAPSLASPVTDFSRLDLERIKRCETRYFISRILGIPEETSLERGIELHVVGLKVHALLNELYRSVPALSASDPGELLRRFHALFDEQFRDGLFFTGEEQLMQKLLKNGLLAVVRRDLDRFAAGYRLCRELMEKELSARLEGREGVYTLTGRIDRVDLTPEGSYEIIDYKTGKLPGRREHMPEGGFAQAQLGFYGLLFSKNYPERSIGALSYYDLMGRKDTVRIVEKDGVPQYLDEFVAHLLSLFDDFNGKRGLRLTSDYDNCNFCPYDTICRVFEE
jgi:hypothetical protein